MITEGYIKELRISKGEVKNDEGEQKGEQKGKVELKIEPTSPFAIEYEGKRCMLLCNPVYGKDGTCSLKNGACSLRDIGSEFDIDLGEEHKVCAPNLMATFKASHTKCRFTIDKKTITKVTAL